MSDYLSRLVARTLRSEAVLRPRILSRFEPLNPLNHSQPLEWQPKDEVEVFQQEHATDPPEASRVRRDTGNSPSGRPRQIEPEPYRGKYVSPTLLQPANPPLQHEQESHQVSRNEDRRSVSQEIPLIASETAKVPHKMAEAPDKNTSDDQTVQPRSVQPLIHGPAAVPPAASAVEMRSTKPWSNKEPFVERATAGGTTKRSESNWVAKGQQVAPTVKVHIGRIDVRAVMPAVPSPQRPRGARPKAELSLDDYLKQRGEGRRWVTISPLLPSVRR
jgi:hypothetical protein